jgi:hypothetical protein
MVLAVWRASRRLLRARAAFTLATAIAITTLSGLTASATLAVALAGIVALCVWEQRLESFEPPTVPPPSRTGAAPARDPHIPSH